MFGTKTKTVRYAVVGAGDIAQEALMPGVKHTGNSELVAVVTGDPEKARALTKTYDLKTSCGYDGYDALLRSGEIDAIYLALPNDQHREYAVKALEAGIHVLLEKPSDSNEDAEAILTAAQSSKAKLMVAYRLHFEPATLAAIEKVRSGKLGRVHSFTSHFSQCVSPQNHRAKNGWAAGPMLDMGVYPLNAVRNLFGCEPTEVFALSSRHPESGLGDLDDTVAVTLRFPDQRLAQFTVSYFGNPIDSYTVIGDKGVLTVSPGFMFGKGLAHTLAVEGKETRKEFSATDQFGGELKYFSDCILNGTDPEPDAEEGYLDVRVCDAVRKSIETGQVVKLESRQRTRCITPAQEQKLAAVKPPKPVNAAKPSEG